MEDSMNAISDIFAASDPDSGEVESEEIIPSEGDPEQPAVEVVDVGQADPEDSPTIDQVDGDPEPVEEEKVYFDASQYAGQVARVKINGEEVEVPVEELSQGYMRHADYTQKTQEVAFWRQVDQAMRDPQTAPQALEYLAKTFGVEAAQAVAAQHADDDDSYVDPIEARLAATEQRQAQQDSYIAQQQAVAHLNQVVGNLTQKYGDTFDAQTVVTEAVNQGVTDPDQLETVYKVMQYERVMARDAAQAQTAQQRLASDAKKAAAAQAAAAIVGDSGGSAVAPPPVVSANPAQPGSVREAWALAKAELGLS